MNEIKPFISPYQPTTPEFTVEFRVPIYPPIVVDGSYSYVSGEKEIKLRKMLIQTIYENSLSTTVEIKWAVEDYPPEYTKQQIIEILEEYGNK